MINNLELIKPLLTYGDKEDFYLIQIMQRQKDISDPKSRKTRVVKEYYVTSNEYLDKKYEEIINLAIFYQARVYINLNLIKSRQLGLSILRELSNLLEYEESKYTNILSKAIGQCVVKDKRWVVDIDDLNIYNKVKNIINLAHPKFDNNILLEVPTVNGCHLITTPFNPENLYKEFSKDILRKNNPTLLYFDKET